MATIYFTNNSDSGDGSFRDTLTNSSPGDTIAPDPNVDWGGETITILLSSPIAWGNRSRTITGGTYHRIRFDGQGTVNHINFSSSNTITFERCDFVRGYRETFGAMFQATNASPTIVFKDCLCAGNKSNGDSAAYDLSSNSSSYKYDVTAINCVIAGDAQAFVTGVRATNVIFKNCTLAKNLSTPSTSDIVRFSNCIRYINSDETDVGFVNVPTTVYNADTWTANLWQTWDARLKPGSQYLTGYDGDEITDFLGHTRKQNGALGAYAGSWLVLNETTTVDETTEVDYIDIKDSASVTLANDVVLRATEKATVGSASLSATETAFLVAPTLSIDESATFANVDTLDEFAGLVSCSADETAVYWEAEEDEDAYIVLQQRIDNAWVTLGKFNGESYENDFNVGDAFRLFDGYTFLTCSVPLPPPEEAYFFVKNWAVMETIVSSWAVPETGGIDPQTGEPLPSWTVAGSAIGPNF